MSGEDHTLGVLQGPIPSWCHLGPWVGNKVVIGAGAILLGPIVIGDNARVGAGSVVIKDVSAGSTVVGVPAKEIKNKATKKISGIDLNHNKLSDPVIEVFHRLEKRIKELEDSLKNKGRKDGQ